MGVNLEFVRTWWESVPTDGLETRAAITTALLLLLLLVGPLIDRPFSAGVSCVDTAAYRCQLVKKQDEKARRVWACAVMAWTVMYTLHQYLTEADMSIQLSVLFLSLVIPIALATVPPEMQDKYGGVNQLIHLTWLVVCSQVFDMGGADVPNGLFGFGSLWSRWPLAMYIWNIFSIERPSVYILNALMIESLVAPGWDHFVCLSFLQNQLLCLISFLVWRRALHPDASPKTLGYADQTPQSAGEGAQSQEAARLSSEDSTSSASQFGVGVGVGDDDDDVHSEEHEPYNDFLIAEQSGCYAEVAEQSGCYAEGAGTTFLKEQQRELMRKEDMLQMMAQSNDGPTTKETTPVNSSSLSDSQFGVDGNPGVLPDELADELVVVPAYSIYDMEQSGAFSNKQPQEVIQDQEDMMHVLRNPDEETSSQPLKRESGFCSDKPLLDPIIPQQSTPFVGNKRARIETETAAVMPLPTVHPGVSNPMCLSCTAVGAHFLESMVQMAADAMAIVNVETGMATCANAAFFNLVIKLGAGDYALGDIALRSKFLQNIPQHPQTLCDTVGPNALRVQSHTKHAGPPGSQVILWTIRQYETLPYNGIAQSQPLQVQPSQPNPPLPPPVPPNIQQTHPVQRPTSMMSTSANVTSEQTRAIGASAQDTANVNLKVLTNYHPQTQEPSYQKLWRQYGEKPVLKASPKFPRSSLKRRYYRCFKKDCPARLKVDVYVATGEQVSIQTSGLHSHNVVPMPKEPAMLECTSS